MLGVQTGFRVSVKGDVKQVIRHLNSTQRRKLPRIVASALNRAAERSGTTARRDAAKELNIPKKLIKNRVQHKARDKASMKKQIASIWTGLSKMPAAKIATDAQKQRGLKQNTLPLAQRRNKVIKIRGREFPNAFYAQMKSGHIGLFKRQGRKRLKINEIRIDIQEAIERVAGRAIERVGVPEFIKRFEHELRRQLGIEGLL